MTTSASVLLEQMFHSSLTELAPDGRLGVDLGTKDFLILRKSPIEVNRNFLTHPLKIAIDSLLLKRWFFKIYT